MSSTPRRPHPFQHGLYLPYLTKSEAAGVRKAALLEVQQEIGVLRVSIARLLKLGMEEKDVEAQTKIARGVALLVNTLNTSLRTHELLFGSYSALDEALELALEAEPFYLSGTPPDLPKGPPVEPTGEEAARWRQIFAVSPNQRSKRSRRR